MDNRTITIIVPVYKAEMTIKRCVDSILTQTYRNWELILVDDGSPDKSGLICDQYAASDSRIRSIHISNEGAGNARNHGLDKCNSKWVTFVDSDDSLEPGYLANFHILDSSDESEIIIMQGYRRVTKNKEPLEEKIELHRAVYSGDEFMENAFSSDTIFEYGQVVGKLYNINVIRNARIKFTSAFQLSEDHLFYLTYLTHAKKILTYEGVLYNYIWEEGYVGLSRRPHPYRNLFRRYQELLAACERLKHRHKFSSNSLAKIDYFSVTGSLSLMLRGLYQQENDRKKRLELLRQSIDTKRIRCSFHPNSFNGKVLKAILLGLPLSVGDILMKKALKSAL